MQKDKPEKETARATTWERPAIEWESEYEPVVFAVSCTSQMVNCGAGARY